MDQFLIFLLFVTSLFTSPFVLIAQTPTPIISHISVVGAVYCDTCSTSTFSKHSYFLQGKKLINQSRDEWSVSFDFAMHCFIGFVLINLSINQVLKFTYSADLEQPHQKPASR